MVAQDALDLFVENHYVIVVDTPVDVCVSRIREGKYDGILSPFNGADEEIIRRTYDFLRSRTSADGASIFPYCGWTGCCLCRNR